MLAEQYGGLRGEDGKASVCDSVSNITRGIRNKDSGGGSDGLL